LKVEKVEYWKNLFLLMKKKSQRKIKFMLKIMNKKKIEKKRKMRKSVKSKEKW